MKSWGDHITHNFRLGEFISPYDKKKLSPDQLYNWIDSDLVMTLQHIRNHYQKSIRVTSGYRSLEYHKMLYKGSKYPAGSLHLINKAIDFVVTDVDSKEVRKWIKDNWETNLTLRHITGLEDFKGMSWVHIDSRNSTHLQVFTG